MAEATNIKTFDEVVEMVKQELPLLYEAFYPIEHWVKETGSLEYKTITQANMIYFESRDITHFIAGTGKLYDLLKPMQYEHKVFVYREETATWDYIKYGTELECRAFVIAEQAKRYGFDYKEYMQAKGRVQLFLNRMEEATTNFTENEGETVQELINTITRSLRLKLDLAEDDDLPSL
jgi:hypothetical protein